MPKKASNWRILRRRWARNSGNSKKIHLELAPIFLFRAWGYYLKVSHAKEIPSGGHESDSLENRIREAIDFANEASAAAAYNGASMHPERLVPVKAVRIDEISGAAFVQHFLPHLKVTERLGSIQIDWAQFCALRDCIFRGVSPLELKKVSQTNAKQTTKKPKYERGEEKNKITIVRGSSQRKDGRKYMSDMLYYRAQLEGHPLNIKLGRDVNSAFKKARKIKRAIEERRDPISVLEEFMPDSKLLPKLKRDKQADERTVPASISAESLAQFNSTGGAVTIQRLVNAYLKGAATVSYTHLTLPTNREV